MNRSLLILCILLLSPAVSAQEQVRVTPVVRAVLTEQLPLSGSILSPRNSNLSTQESGLVVVMNVETGDRVQQGDVLLQLDDATTQFELERLMARRQEAELAYENARRLANEGRSLIEDRNIPRTEYESRLVNEAQEQSRLQQLEVQISLQQLRLERHTLRAPFDGVVGFREAELGEWLSAGSLAMQLVQTDPVRVQASIPERYFGEVVEGTPMTVSVDAYPNRRIETRVERVTMVADIETRSFIVRADIANEDDSLAPGMSAHLLFMLGGDASRPVLQVPADAVVRRRDGEAVVWVVRGETAEPVTVRIGRRNQSRVEVYAEELREGDLVVTLGNESLRPGQAVAAVRDG